ncbi:beta-ketoacyl synthase N-terminal-like domain-containing protein [Caballeronia sp. J97]|uniref:beta-ketoacyl synthase N-terminal-like domain-containing protein n=1 Tax=Caballeronia sp. J97 TaxID=2805429 RepID=UPI002AB18B7E|nr:beta-ketoacyl synthase N-terminal-like domain-containing protein [Caballeronia sp. J97]
MDPLDPNTSIAIVGAGVRCAVGLASQSAAAAVRAGISGLREHAWLLDKVGAPMMVAPEPTLDPGLQDARRFAHLAAPALTEALAVLTRINASPETVPAMIGLPGARPGLPADIEDALIDVMAITKYTSGKADIRFFPNGSASGLLALKHSRDILLGGASRFCLVGGVDSYLMADSLEWMDEVGMLKSPANRNGFPPGEAAGFCLLTTGATARLMGLDVVGWLHAVEIAQEPSPIRTSTICVGLGLSQAIRRASASLKLPDERFDNSICDLNGEPYRSEEFALTVLRTQLAFVDATRFVTPADCWGDVGAASGPLFVNLAVEAAARGYAKGPLTLLWASSEGGERAAAVVHTPL